MSGQHTAGPWHVGENNDQAIVFDADGWAVCDCKTYHRKGRIDEMRSNARLIAAAPDLLDALERAVKWLVICDDPRSEKDLAVAETALRKARGGQSTPGWADQRLAQAYALIDEVIDDPEAAIEDVRDALVKANDLIETADCELEKWA